MKVIDIAVPDLGNFAEVPVIDVLVKVGDTVEAEAPLITLETDKASMDVQRRQGRLPWRLPRPLRWLLQRSRPGLSPASQSTLRCSYSVRGLAATPRPSEPPISGLR